MTPAVMFDGADLRVLHLDQGHSRLMVTFDFRTKGKTDFGPVNTGRGFGANGFDQLMIKTRRNDWFINGDTARMEAMLGPLTARYDHVHALGYSMGGYAAFRFAANLRADFVAAVSPQLTIDPAAVPFDRRYRAEAVGFDALVGQIPGNDTLAGFLVFDPFNRPDREHAIRLQHVFPRITLLRTSHGGHPATGVLRQAGRGGVVQRAAMGLVPPVRILKAHRAARAASLGYWTRLARALEPRNPITAAQAHQRANDLGGNAPDLAS